MEVPFDFRSLTSHFSHLLTQAQFLYIFIDGVDQLSPDDGALGLSWLPLQLPPHVKMVVSTSSEVEYGCYPVLRSLIKMEDCFIQVWCVEMKKEEAIFAYLNAWILIFKISIYFFL